MRKPAGDGVIEMTYESEIPLSRISVIEAVHAFEVSRA